MSERLPISERSGEQAENLDASAEARKNLERIQEAAEQAERDPLQKQINSLESSAKQEAISGQELNVGDTNTEQSNQTFGNSKEIKAEAYTKTLRKIRTHLNVPERTLSRVVHNPIIESTSNAVARTAARPSGILGGSFGALVGSAALLYLSRQNGFTYNYAVLLLLFVAGYFVGLIIELLVTRVFRRKLR